MYLILVLHPTQPFLARDRLVVHRETVFDAGLLDIFKHHAVGGLLVGIVLRKARTLVFAVRALDVEALVEVLILFFQLLDLETHQSVLAQVFHVLETRSTKTVQ